MADSRKRDCVNDQSNGGNTSDASLIDIQPESSSFVVDTAVESSQFESENESPDVVDNDGDGDIDLFLDEDRVLRWLQALDMQVLGACRADERLKPFLKLNVSNGMAEDRLLAHLSQHFEPAEIRMLARCFCIPLVSVRVGKIKKEGTRMCPTATRGNLSLMLLPTSNLRLTFVGDNGHSERLFTFCSKSQSSAVSIEDISADSSGRSFVIRIQDGRTFYFWCSEKSKLLGMELRRKMKDLMRKKPSVSELTGINESRLGCVAYQLRLYLMGSVVPNINGCSSLSLSSSSGSCDSASSCVSTSLRTRHSGSQPIKASSFHQASLSPRSSSFKENTVKNSSLRISSSKSRRRNDCLLSAFDNLHIASTTTVEASVPTAKEALGDTSIHSPLALQQKSEDFPRPQPPLKITPSVFAPYYCWCPPNSVTSLHSPASAFQQLPPLSIELSSFSSLPTLLPPFGSDGIMSPPPLLDFSQITPSLPLVRHPISSSQQIPTFTPLMCDPIVHIPVIDVCSSGQGYLVSAGPGMPTSIPPLHPNFVNPALPHHESLLEKGARETLRLLIRGSNTATAAAPLINVLTKSEDRPQDVGELSFASMSVFAPLRLLQPEVATDNSSKCPSAKWDTEDGGGGGRSDESIHPK